MTKHYVASGYWLEDGKKIKAAALLIDLPPEVASKIDHKYVVRDAGAYYTNYDDKDLEFSTIEADRSLQVRKRK